jgi:hypothetical protein
LGNPKSYTLPTGTAPPAPIHHYYYDGIESVISSKATSYISNSADTVNMNFPLTAFGSLGSYVLTITYKVDPFWCDRPYEKKITVDVKNRPPVFDSTFT